MVRGVFFYLLFIISTAHGADTIAISAVGDIMMGTTYPSNALPANDGKGLFDPALPWLKAAHIRFGNFEGTFFDGPPQKDGKSVGPNRFAFRTPTRMVSVLKDAGFNVMSLANNHVKDFGAAGVKSTKETLAKAGIQYSSKAGEVARFKVHDTSIALIAADFYKAPRSIVEYADTISEIKNLKANNERVIVSAHAGREGAGAEYIRRGMELFLGEKRGDSIDFSHEAIDAGADVIIMHGPHVPRGVELYKNRIIVYSLGNFMTGKGISLSGYSAIAPLIRIEIHPTGEFASGQIIPFVQLRDPQRIEVDQARGGIVLMKKLSLREFPNSELEIKNDGILNLRSE